jgi:hypothetical protein
MPAKMMVDKDIEIELADIAIAIKLFVLRKQTRPTASFGSCCRKE